MIITVLLTVIFEGAVVLIYSTFYSKPHRLILITSIMANLFTQSLLWIVLNFFYQHYLLTLCFAEILIWIIESLLLYRFRADQLRFPEAAFLSLIMNLASFAIGWFLPV